MIRNSDVLFGRTAATYRFVDRDAIKRSIHEVSSLQVMGFDKRVAQIMFERKYLTEDEVYAIHYSMLCSQQIRKLRLLKTYEFTEADDLLLKKVLGATQAEEGGERVVAITEETREKLGISSEKLSLCLNIHKSLAQNGISTYLLNILYDKKFLTPQVKNLIPDIEAKKRIITQPGGFNPARVRKSIAILYGQIAIINERMTPQQNEKAIAVWERVYEYGVNLKYSELLFYLGYLSQKDSQEISLFLQKISRVDQRPRFHLIRLDDEEELFFTGLQEKKALRQKLVAECSELLEQLRVEGLVHIRLSDLLILKGYLNRKSLAKRREEAIQKQPEGEAKTAEVEKKLVAVFNETQIVDTQAGTEEKAVFAKAETTVMDDLEKTKEEEVQFGQELDEMFHTSREHQQQAIQKEIRQLRERLPHASKEEAKTIQTVIGHYERERRKLKFYLIAGTSLILLLFLGFFVALHNRRSNDTTSLSPETSSNPQDSPAIVKFERQKWQQQVAESIACYDFSQVVSLYEQNISFMPAQRRELLLELEELRMQRKLFEELASIVEGKKNLPLIPFREQTARIVKMAPDRLVLSFEGGALLTVSLKSLKPVELFQIFSGYDFLTLYPWETALFCLQYKLYPQARRALYFYIEQFPEEREKAWQLLAQKTDIAVPIGGFIAYREDLLSPEEYRKVRGPVEEEPAPVHDPPPVEVVKKPALEKRWVDIHYPLLQSKYDAYSEEMKTREAVLYEGRWASAQMAKLEQQMQKRRKKGWVFFAGDWHKKEVLGEWHRVVFADSSLEGYLRKSAKNLYKLQGEYGVRYFSPANIVTMTRGLSPWESYWQRREQISATDSVGHYLLARWCESKDLPRLACIQMEKVLMLSPDHPYARHFLGYTRHRQKWWKIGEVEEPVVSILQTRIPTNQAVLAGLVQWKDEWLPLEEAVWQSLKTKEDIQEGAINSAIFGGTPRKIGKRWLLKYNFADSTPIGAWRNLGEKATIKNGYLEIAASANEATFAYLDIEFTGDLLVRYRAQIAPDYKYDLQTQVFTQLGSEGYSGYLCAFNWREDPASSHSFNIIQAYNRGRPVPLARSASPTIPSGKWYKATIVATDSQISLGLGGQRILKSEDREMRTGGMSFGTIASKVRFDDIEITAEVSDKWYQRRRVEVKEQLQANARYNAMLNLSDTAIKLLAKANKKTVARWKKATKLHWQKKYSEALRQFSLGIEDVSDFPFLWIGRGQTQLKLNNNLAAVEDFSQAIQLHDGIYSAYVGRAIAYQRLRKREEAGSDYAKALSLAPSQAAIYGALAYLYLERNRPEEALAIAKKCFEATQTRDLLDAMEDTLERLRGNASFTKKTANYIVTAETNEVYCEIVGKWLEEFLTYYQKIFGVWLEPGKLRVRVVSDIDRLHAVIIPFSPAEARQKLCYYWPATREIIVTGDVPPDILRFVLFREAFQQLVDRQNAAFPPWLENSFSEYFAHTQERDGKIVWGSVPWHLRQSLIESSAENKRLSPLTLMSLSPVEYYTSRASDLDPLAYGWAHFLLHANSEQYNNKLLSYIAYVRSGSPPAEAATKVFSDFDIKKIGEEWKKYWREIRK